MLPPYSCDAPIHLILYGIFHLQHAQHLNQDQTLKSPISNFINKILEASDLLKRNFQ